MLRNPASYGKNGCFCPIGKCGAPVIMGRQTPCLDPERAKGITEGHHVISTQLAGHSALASERSIQRILHFILEKPDARILVCSESAESANRMIAEIMRRLSLGNIDFTGVIENG